MPGTKKYSYVKSLEWIDCRLNHFSLKQEQLIKETNSINSVLSSSIWAAIFVVPITIAAYMFQPSVEWYSILIYLMIIPAYILLWLLCNYLIVPSLSKNHEVTTDHLKTPVVVYKFNNIIVNKTLVILGIKDSYERSVEELPDVLKKLYLIEILEDWGYIIGFINSDILNNDTSQVIRNQLYKNSSIGNIKKKINTYTLSAIVDILKNIDEFLDKNLLLMFDSPTQIIKDYNDLSKTLDNINSWLKKNFPQVHVN